MNGGAETQKGEYGFQSKSFPGFSVQEWNPEGRVIENPPKVWENAKDDQTPCLSEGGGLQEPPEYFRCYHTLVECQYPLGASGELHRYPVSMDLKQRRAAYEGLDGSAPQLWTGREKRENLSLVLQYNEPTPVAQFCHL